MTRLLTSSPQPLLLLFLILHHLAKGQKDETCLETGDDDVRLKGYSRINSIALTPADLPGVSLYSDWKANFTMELSDRQLHTSTGKLQQMGRGNFTSDFDFVSNVASKKEVEAILKVIEDEELDNDPDTVDGFPSQEIFVDNIDLRAGRGSKSGHESAEDLSRREPLRQALLKITQPILDQRLTPYIRQRYPNECNAAPDRQCTPCFSLIRRYKEGQRQSHAPHRDDHARVTAVISLSAYDQDYSGGLYVASQQGRPFYLPLNQGDAAIHQSDLLHGVKVHPPASGKPTQRWSWIIWFRDSDTCQDYGQEWFVDCAHAGNPTCEFLLASKQSHIADKVVYWNERAAEHGHATARVKLGRAYMGKLGGLTPNRTKGLEYFEQAVVSSNDPDAHYGIATMLLEDSDTEETLKQVVAHLEASALGGHPFAMFNLGIIHLFGYGSERNPELAGDWFEASGLPEGLAARAMHYGAVGMSDKAKEFQKRATDLGFGSNTRILARKSTGYGGASGIDLNLEWPPNDMNKQPPKW